MKPRAKAAPLTYIDLYQSFPWLIWEIVIGQGLTMQDAADRAGIDQGTISKWIHNRTRDPEAPHLRQFARAFGLDPSGLISVLQRDRLRRFLSQAIPMPPLDEIKRGPKPSPRSVRSLRRVKRGLTCLVGAIMVAATSMVPVEAGTPPLVEKASTSDNLGRGIMSIRRRWGANFRSWSQFFVGVFPTLEAQPQAMWHTARLA